MIKELEEVDLVFLLLTEDMDIFVKWSGRDRHCFRQRVQDGGPMLPDWGAFSPGPQCHGCLMKVHSLSAQKLCLCSRLSAHKLSSFLQQVLLPSLCFIELSLSFLLYKVVNVSSNSLGQRFLSRHCSQTSVFWVAFHKRTLPQCSDQSHDAHPYTVRS